MIRTPLSDFRASTLSHPKNAISMSPDLFHPETHNPAAVFADSEKPPTILSHLHCGVIMCHNHNRVLFVIRQGLLVALFLCELREENVVHEYTYLHRGIVYVVHRETMW